MYSTTTRFEFLDHLQNYFGYDLCILLFEHLEQLEEDLEKQLEFDPISLKGGWYNWTAKEWKEEQELFPTVEESTILTAKNGDVLVEAL